MVTSEEKEKRIIIPVEIKQKIFSQIIPKVKNSKVLDIYSDGSFGIASFKKGAGKVEFVESDSKRCNLIRKQLNQLGSFGKVRVFEVTAAEFSKIVTSKYDLIFVFLPEKELNLNIIKNLAEVLKDNGILIYSCSKKRSFPDSFNHTKSIKKIKFEDMKVIFIQKY